MSKYKEAIALNEVNGFLLGRNNYFVGDRDRGTHDSTYTYAQIFCYEKEIDEIAAYKQLDNDICEILNNELLSVYDLTHVLGILWSYFVDRMVENKLLLDWNFSENLKSGLKNQIEQHRVECKKLDDIDWTINAMRTRFGFDLYV